MSTMPKLALGAAVVTAVALGGFMILRPLSTPAVGVPGPTASPSQEPSPSASSSIDTSGWSLYTSARYGFSTRVPSNFDVTPAVSTWVVPETAATSYTEWDTFDDPLGATDFVGASVRLPAGMTFDAWAAAYLQNQANMANPSAPPSDPCDPRNEPVIPMTIDGHDASLRVGCSVMEVLLSAGGRVYSFTGWKNVEDTFPLPPADPIRLEVEAWFTTIKLDPASAVEPPAGS